MLIPTHPVLISFMNPNADPLFEEVTKTGPGSGTVPVPSSVAGDAFACLTTFSGVLNSTRLSSFGNLAGPLKLADLKGFDKPRARFGAREKGNWDYSWNNPPI
jgi:hypothetical protein